MSSAFVYLGSGYAAVEQFGMITNMYVFCKNAFAKHQKKIHKACMNAVNKCLQAARSKSKKIYEDLSIDKASTFVKATVSFDASWLTRGHRSKHILQQRLTFVK